MANPTSADGTSGWPADEQLPAVVLPDAAPALDRPEPTLVVPALVTDAGGENAGWRYVESFTANINNDHTRRAYARACNRFFAWCEDRGLSLTAIRPFDVAAWVNELQHQHKAPSVKQQLAAVRMLFDWLVTGQIVPMNPATAVRGPKHVVKTGKTPVLEAAEWRRLIDSIPTATVRDLRDRALIATLTYSFARITAALKMKVEDLRPKGAGWQVQLHEKGGKQHMMPCHHALAEALHVVSLHVFRILAPFGEGLLDRDHLPAHATSSARFRVNAISRRGVFWVFFTNTRRTTTRLPVAVTWGAASPPVNALSLVHRGRVAIRHHSEVFLPVTRGLWV
jgi:integrase